MSENHNQTRYPQNLDENSIKYAQEYLKESPEKREEYLKKLRQHFQDNQNNESETIKITTEDDIPLAFLRSTKYDLQRAIDKLTNYYRMRAAMPAVFSDRDPRTARMQEILQLGCFVPLRKLQNGRLTVIVRASAFDPKEYTLEEILKTAYMILDICNRICPQMQVHGICAIFDLEGMSLGHARLMTPSILKHMVQSWENYHCRPKQLEFINAPRFINVILSIVRSLMRKKMRDRLRVHSNGITSLTEIIDRDVLPEEYEGLDGTFQSHVDFWVGEITKQAGWFLFDEKNFLKLN